MTSRLLSAVHPISRTSVSAIRSLRQRTSISGVICQSRVFSVSSCRPIMEMSGFTPEQLDVREAVSKICSKYPDVCSAHMFPSALVNAA